MKTLFKVIVAAAALLLEGQNASAQLGIHAGYSRPDYVLHLTDFLENQRINSNGMYAGVDYDINIVGGLSVQPGLFWSFEYAERNLLQVLKVSLNDHRLTLPVHLKYSFDVAESVKIYAFGGPKLSMGLVSQAGLGLGLDLFDAKVKYDLYSGKLNVNSSQVTEKIEDLLDYQFENGVAMNRFDVQLGIGLGIQLMDHFELKAGYDWGMLNLVRVNLTQSDSYKKDFFYVGVGYRF